MTRVMVLLLVLSGCADVWGFEDGIEKGPVGKDSGSSSSSSTGSGPTTDASSSTGLSGTVGSTSSSGSGGSAGSFGSGGSGGTGGCEGSLCTDSKNCGYENHDCLGGLCKEGVCQSALVYSDPGQGIGIESIAVDGYTLFWSWVSFQTGAMAISRCTTGACGDTKTDLTNFGSSYLYAKSGLLYFQDAGLERCPETDCTSPASINGPGGNIAVSDTYIFWPDGFAVQRCALSDCLNTKTQLTPNTAMGGLEHVGANSTFVFWEEDIYVDKKGAIFGCNQENCVPQTMAIDVTNAYQVAADDQTLYWSSSDGFFKCSISDCANTTVKIIDRSEVTTIGSIAADSVSFYYVDGKSIYRLAK